MSLFRRSILSAPRAVTFLVAVVLAVIAVASLYTRIPWVGVGPHRFWLMTAAFVVLALGTLLRDL